MSRSTALAPILCGLQWLYACGASTPPARIAPEQAMSYLGREATVCGVVVRSVYDAHASGRPTVLYLTRAGPDPALTVVIWGRDRHRFDPPPDVLFRDRRVCVTGLIRLFENHPQIVVRLPAEIVLDDDVLFPPGATDLLRASHRAGCPVA